MAEQAKPRKKRKKIIRIVVMLVIAAAVIIAGIRYLPGILKGDGGDSTDLLKTTAVVERGEVSRSLGVSSSIQPTEIKGYKTAYNSELLEVAVSEGDYITEGTLIMRLSTETTDDLINNIEEQIENLNEQIDNIHDAIEDSISSIEDHNNNIADRNEDITDLRNEIIETEIEITDNEAKKDKLTIYAPIDGTVFDVLVSEGDFVMPGSALAVITDPTAFEVEFPVSASYLDEEVTQVNVHYLGMDFEAEIVSNSSYTYYDRHRHELVDTVLSFSTDVSIAPGATVTASIKTDENSYFIHDGQAPYYAETETVLSEVSGEILSLYMIEKQSISQGNLIVHIDSADIDDTTENFIDQITSRQEQIEAMQDANEATLETITQLNDNIADFEEDILDIMEDIENLESDLGEALDGYSEAELRAEFDGYVINISSDEGDDVNAGQNLFNLVSMSSPKLLLTIDELDIPEIKEGLAAEVTIDALVFTEENPIPATVTGITISGNAQGGVTTYTVTVELNESVNGLLPGMSGTGTIFISRNENTLFVPIEAVTIKDGKSYVWITTDVTADKTTIDKTNYDKSAASGKTGGKAAGNRPAIGEKDTSKMTAEQKAKYDEYLKNQGKGEIETSDSGDNTVSSIEEYYTGATMTEVTTGIHNETQIEILSGVTEGQVVLLPPVYLSDSKDGTTQDGGFNMGTARKAMGGIGK